MGPDSPLALAGFGGEDEHLYRTLLQCSGLSRAQLAIATGLPQEVLDGAVTRFAERGLVHEVVGVVTAVPPDEALGEVLRAETERVRVAGDRLDALRNLVPSLVSDFLSSRHRSGSSVQVHAVEGVDVPHLIKSLAQDHSGDLLWMRPDQWRLPVTEEMDDWVRDMVATNRASRALYPAHVLATSPETLRTRAEAGEHVRIVASVPSRVVVIGEAVALLPERWGANSARLLVVREHSLVGAMIALFEVMWERAMPVPGFGGMDGDTGDQGRRGMLLRQLALGAKDEQIARTLGLSLRTVRRRVAEVMDELGAGSRFQAGVEAVRRGWI